MNCEIDGKSFTVELPASVGELCQLVRDGGARGLAIYPVGGRTMLDFGLPPARDGIALDTTRLDRIIDYPSRDMTITVEAGIRVAKLQEILRAEGQRLPIDVPRAAEATLGGAIATNMSGPRRYRFGTFRDYVIGVSVVDAAGNETKAGGRVVKNVAGYDLCKLYTGSLATLGIITQVTLKLRPMPEASAVVWSTLESPERAAEALDRLALSRTQPTAIELLNPLATEYVTRQLSTQYSVLSTQYSVPSTQHSTPTTQHSLPVGSWALVVGFEEGTDAVKWQQGQLHRELDGPYSSRQVFDGPDAAAVWSALVEFQAAELGPVTIKANFRNSAAIEFLNAAARQPVGWSVQVHAGNGIAHAHATVGNDRAAVRSNLANLREKAVALTGNLIVRRCPTEWKRELLVWGEPRGDYWLMQAIKRKLDPNDLLNPGRFIRTDA